MTTELMIYGDIGQDWWSGDGITEEMVHDGLKQLDQTANKHVIHINSPGGRVDVGLAIMNMLRSHAAQMKAANSGFQLETVCDAYAMSIASVFFMAGDIRTIALGGVVMIHDAWSGCYGNAADMRKAADVLELQSNNISNIYATLCTPAEKDQPVRDAAFFRAKMQAETFMIGDDAVKCGLATNMDTAITAQTISDFAPEKLKGNYVNTMTASYKKRTFSRPTAAASILNSKLALQRLEVLSASVLGTNC